MAERDSFDAFTEQARKVLSLAQEEAQRFQHSYIGTEHLLLGLIGEGEGVTAKVLSNLGVQLNKIRSAIEFVIGRGDRIVLGAIGLTPRAKRVIELAVDEAQRLNHAYIGTEHLLLGLVREGEGVAVGVLESLGVNLEDARKQTMKVLGLGQETSSQPEQQEPVQHASYNQEQESREKQELRMGHFFIAYSRRDFYFTESLFYALSSKGINAWMDVWKITPGDDWDHAITNAIQSSQGLILIATKESLQSPYVKDEICWAFQAQKPIYLVIRGGFSKQDLLISHESLKGGNIKLYDYARVIVDMRADFTKGLEKIIDAITRNAVYQDKLPGSFGFKMEKILYIPPVIVFLALFMVITEFWKFGVGFFYFDQLSQLMGYIRDIIHGAIGEILLLGPTMIESIVTIGSLVIIIIFGFNFSRRKHVRSVNTFVLLLTSAVITGLITLFTDVPAVTLEAIYFLSPVGDFLKRGESAPSLDMALFLLLVVHGILFILIIILAIVFGILYFARDGREAILRWLPTGYASEIIRRKGNKEWIRNLPDIRVSQAPPYKSYFIVASPADLSTAQEIRSMLQEEGYIVTDDPEEAECRLIILSPFADDSLLKHDDKVHHPVIYVVSRSMKPPKDTSIALQWIDYRRPTEEQFWKQWERHFSGLQGNNPVFPYVPEALGDSLLPMKYGGGIRSMMIAVVVGSALLISGMDYIVLLRNAMNSLLLPAIALLLGAMGISYYTIAQMMRGVISSIQARRRLVTAGILTMIAALMSQSPLLIGGSLGVVLVNRFMANRPSLRTWLPPQTKKPHKKSPLQPISNYKIFTSYEYSGIMILGFLALNALITNSWILPNIPSQSASKPYAVTVPGPYYLAAPGLWSQDTHAEAFGYHFDYHPDKLEISQDQGIGYPTWLKFLGADSYPMRFAPHFSSSIHVHFTNNEVRTDFGLVLNDFVKVDPGDLIGPQLRLSASGLWTVIESNGRHYSGQVAKKELSHDYTLEVEVNGILCTYKINGKEITAIAETSLSSIHDIMFSFVNYVPGGTTYDLSNFTYTPIPGPVLSRNEAIKLVTTLNTAPYTTVAPGWNCNPNDGRWNAGYEPVHQTPALTCTPTGTRLNTSAKKGVLLNFDNNAFGELPDAFDYSFDATFEGASVQCIAIGTYANITKAIAYVYAFNICSDGNWVTRYGGYYREDGSVLPNKQLKSGHINIKTTIAVFVKFRSTTQNFYINNQLITSYKDSDLKPTIFFGNDKGAVLYSNFSFVPRTPQ